MGDVVHSSLLLLLVSALAFVLAGCGREKKAAPQAPIVEVVEVAQKDVPVYAEWVATLDGMVNATIKAQVQGYLIKQNYKEGDLVKKGQVLFEIDPRPFQAALEEAKGQLAQSEARWQTAKANLARIRPLAAQNAVSKKDLDDAIGAEESTQRVGHHGKGEPRQGPAQPRMDQGHLPYRRHRGYRQGTDRKPRRPGA